LARKIEQASNRKLKVTVSSEAATAGAGGMDALFAGLQRLTITARDGTTGAGLTAGETGRDALAGLGLSQGYIGATTGDDVTRTFGLNLSASLNLNSAEGIKASGEGLQAALKAVRDAYRALDPATTAPKPTGQVPAYLTAQIANYQAALARLTG